MATMRDVARVARVAPSTVSFVLNGGARVKLETRKRVEAAIKSLDYVPRRAGRPNANRQLRVGLVVGSKYFHAPAPMTEKYSSSSTEAATAVGHGNRMRINMVREAIVLHGHHLNCFAGFGKIDHDAMLCETVERGQLDGAILVATSPEDGYLDWLLDRDVPIVVLNRRPEPPQRFSFVEMDNFGGGWQVADYFLASGHRSMAVVQSESRYTYNRDRVQGFVQRLAKDGVSPLCIASPATDEALASTCRDIVEKRATAVFATSDTLARECVECWMADGVAVPRDLSVAGFDNIGLRTTGGLAITSVAYDPNAMAEALVKCLEELCWRRGRLEYVTATVSAQFVEHDTSGKPSTASVSKVKQA